MTLSLHTVSSFEQKELNLKTTSQHNTCQDSTLLNLNVKKTKVCYHCNMDLVRNKKATFHHEILEEFEAGIELLGHEVKSIRNKMGSLEGSRVTVRGGEGFLMGATVQPYQPNNITNDYDPNRNRRLLLDKKTLAGLSKAEDTKGLTIVPISWYNKGKNIKLRIAIARGKKQFDKRETIKKRDTERDLRREFKR